MTAIPRVAHLACWLHGDRGAEIPVCFTYALIEVPQSLAFDEHPPMVKVMLVFTILAGCHVGAGPVIAHSSKGGFRLGFDASGGIGFARGSVGSTWAFSDQPARVYLTGDPGLVYPFSQQYSMHRRVFLVGGGATIGKAWGNDDSGLAIGGWASGGLYRDEQRCQDGYLTYSIAIGYRVLAGIDEVFLAPKIAGFFVPLPCT